MKIKPTTQEEAEFLGLIDTAKVYVLFDENGYYHTMVMEDVNQFDDDGNIIGSDYYELDPVNFMFTLADNTAQTAFLDDQEWVEVIPGREADVASLMYHSEGMSHMYPEDPWHVSEIEPFIRHKFDEDSPFWSEEEETR